MSEPVRRRGAVYLLQFHIVWCVKYRKAVLNTVNSAVLRELLDKIAADNNCLIEEFNYEPGHVHLLVSATPDVHITSLIKAFKGSSARFMFRRFPELRKSLWGGHLWNPTYFIATVSPNTEEQIRSYIQGQDNGAVV